MSLKRRVYLGDVTGLPQHFIGQTFFPLFALHAKSLPLQSRISTSSNETSARHIGFVQCFVFSFVSCFCVFMENCGASYRIVLWERVGGASYRLVLWEHVG
ncbi:hypothetical protein NL108_015375 [Boleophthalmus pectinirostris]|nr:hypothetical protein NL108_015375 [Boleophthalmus pectinirostris]